MYKFVRVLLFFIVCFLKSQINELDTNRNKEENIIEKSKYPIIAKGRGISIIVI